MECYYRLLYLNLQNSFRFRNKRRLKYCGNKQSTKSSISFLKNSVQTIAKELLRLRIHTAGLHAIVRFAHNFGGHFNRSRFFFPVRYAEPKF